MKEEKQLTDLVWECSHTKVTKKWILRKQSSTEIPVRKQTFDEMNQDIAHDAILVYPIFELYLEKNWCKWPSMKISDCSK